MKSAFRAIWIALYARRLSRRSTICWILRLTGLSGLINTHVLSNGVIIVPAIMNASCIPKPVRVRPIRKWMGTIFRPNVKMPKLRKQTLDTAIIERYKRRKSSVEEALMEKR